MLREKFSIALLWSFGIELSGTLMNCWSWKYSKLDEVYHDRLKDVGSSQLAAVVFSPAKDNDNKTGNLEIVIINHNA